MQRHNADLQTLLDVLPVGVAIAEDPTCQRIRLNRYFAERWGLPANANVSPALPPRERPLHYKVFKEGVEASLSEMPMFVAASRGIEVPDEEFQVVLDDGRAVALWVSAAPLLDEQGRPRGSVAAMQDITERRRAEAERAELLAREQQARQEAEAMRAQAEAANRAKDRFLAMLSHELRTPLTPVLLTVSAMLDDPRTPADFRPSLEMIRQNIELEARLIDDLLDVMRTIRGKMSFHWDVVDAHALIGKALDICRSDIQDKRIRLTLDLAATRASCQGRRRATAAGLVEPREERGEVHARGGHDRPPHAGRGRPAGRRSDRHGHRHRAGGPVPDLRRLRAGGEHDHASVRRAGPGAGHQQGDRRGPRGDPDRRQCG